MTYKHDKKGHAPRVHGLSLKKEFGQHFLREQACVDAMLDAVSLTQESSILEIGCGDGFLTKDLIQAPHKQLWIFEIDEHWADYVSTLYGVEKVEMIVDDVLNIDFSILEPDAPWHILANLPYNITFPLLHKIRVHRHLFGPSVIMIQEEVAQKLVACRGRGYGYVSLYFQHYFDMHLLRKVYPGAFLPPPKVESRLVYLNPRKELEEIPDEEGFWKFIKVCFHQPTQTCHEHRHINLSPGDMHLKTQPHAAGFLCHL